VGGVPAGVAAVEASRKLAASNLEPAVETSTESIADISTEPAVGSSAGPAEASPSVSAVPVSSESAVPTSSPLAVGGTAHQSTVLAAIFGGAGSGAVTSDETTGLAAGTDAAVDRDVNTPTERATTERATSIRSEGLYSEPSHQARERFAERSESPDISSISSEEEEAEILQATRGRSGRSEVSDDEFEEARDRFDETGSRISFARDHGDDSPARTNSKFQEQLSL